MSQRFFARTCRVVACAALLGFGFTTTASAALISVDADSFVSGTNISNAFAGVTLSAVGSGFGSGPSIFSVASGTQSLEPFTASTGTQVFGTNAGSFPHLFREPSFVAMRVDFAIATDFVSIDYIANDDFDQGFLQAFDAFNNLLGTYTTAALGTNAFETMSFSFGSASIAYILASGLDGGSSGGLDNLRYEGGARVPEPLSLGLLGLGLAALTLSRRKHA